MTGSSLASLQPFRCIILSPSASEALTVCSWRSPTSSRSLSSTASSRFRNSSSTDKSSFGPAPALVPSDSKSSSLLSNRFRYSFQRALFSGDRLFAPLTLLFPPPTPCSLLTFWPPSSVSASLSICNLFRVFFPFLTFFLVNSFSWQPPSSSTTRTSATAQSVCPGFKMSSSFKKDNISRS